jgi:mono/diheme cytochrome c family protein
MQRINVALPQLVPAEMADLLAYLYSVRYLAPVGDAHAGAAVANAKGCLTCHALGGERGKRASDLGRARSVDSPAGLLSALWNHAFLGERRAARERAPWAEMNGAQMADLLAFLRSVRVAP